MKILNVEQIRETDNYTIINEPIISIDLMERAAGQCANWILNKFSDDKDFKIFVGLGNNGGDGIAIARLLSEQNKHVQVYIVKISDSFADDLKINLKRLEKIDVQINKIKIERDIPIIKDSDIIIDAIFGSGLSRPVSGIAEQVITQINSNKNKTIAIDIPSGLFVEDNRKNINETIVKANYTLTFQFPKLAFLFSENHKFVGIWKILDIGLHKDFIDKTEVNNFFISKNDIKINARNKFAHKGNFGHALLIAGSFGKMGAAFLSSKACLKSGVGLLTSYIPKNGNNIIQTSIPETMIICDSNDNFISEIPNLDNFSAIGIGPGIGQNEKTFEALKNLISNWKKTLVIDADGLNHLSKDKSLYKQLPENTILTPHPKEFERLFGKSKSDFDRFILQKKMSVKYKIIIVLKGANTIVSMPNGNSWFNSTGNVGMATAGSGDVLTGIILSLLAQNYNSEEAAKIGVYIHGLAGDFALSSQSVESLIASDIIDNLANAFNFVKK